ncbi:MAG: ATP-binding protein [Spirochaetales bacterium]|nr:ATP-binding protein [Spirochaetales bacterium]MBR0521502.1 ATP-binding protein [Spirochaetales bacterium]
MYRKVWEKLLEWKNSPFRKPLVVQGARQVGKTYLISEFGEKNYDNVAYFNFQTNSALNCTFDENIEPSYLIPILSRLSGQTIIRGKTLIVFDEVQLCERALTSLKYFYEQANDYHVIAAGSLLGIAVNREANSFPVGKVDRLTMFPLDFEEFLIASGEEKLAREIRDHFNRRTALPTVSHEAALRLYRQYLTVGGMPEAVSRYIETKNHTLVTHIHDSILMGYLDDMSKYQKNAADISKTRLAYNMIGVQLSKPNTRFIYKILKRGARASEFENAIEWLTLANVVSRINRVNDVKKPLETHKDISAFKIYLSDTGLLCAQEKVLPDDIIYENPELDSFKGGLTENYVNSQLIVNGYRPYYYEEEAKAEIDFLIEKQGRIIPLEVKSSEHTKSKSLNYYIEKYSPDYAIRISTKNFGEENGILSVPLYAVFCL